MNIIKINPQPYEGDLNIAQSKMWGSADLPHTFKYPTYEDEEGDDCHYVFVAQINCEEVAPFDKENRLPHTGMLYFFAKIDYYMGEFLAEPMCDGFWDLGDVKVLYTIINFSVVPHTLLTMSTLTNMRCYSNSTVVTSRME